MNIHESRIGFYRRQLRWRR